MDTKRRPVTNPNGGSVDGDALISFLEGQYPVLSGMLTLYCGDPQLAEELAQETLARACRDWPKLERMESPASWTHRVAVNLANSHFRRAAIERRIRQTLHEPDHHVTYRRMPEEMSVRAALADLPRRQRLAIVLRYYRELSVRETAQVMDCPDSTVKTLTRRGLLSLQRRLHLQEEGSGF